MWASLHRNARPTALIALMRWGHSTNIHAFATLFDAESLRQANMSDNKLN